MTDKLSLYNLALYHLEERALSSLTENREPRRVLDRIYAQELAYCLERKFWNFGYRTVEVEASTSVTPNFGYLYAFAIPQDWIRTRRLSAVPQLDPPLLDVSEETGYWYANLNPIYVQYNSNDPLYGTNLGAWPASFTDYVSKRLARVACARITGKRDLLQGREGLINQEERAYKIASANCAMNEAIGFKPMSGWIRSRRMPGLGTDDPTGNSLIP